MREIFYLSKEYSVTAIGYGASPSDLIPHADVKFIEIPRSSRTFFRRFKDLFRVMRYLLGTVDRQKVLNKAEKSKAHVYIANNWDTLPVAARAAIKNDAKLVLDIHEALHTGSGWLYNLLNRITIQRYQKYVSASTTVVQAISDMYLEEFDFRPTVLRNIPHFVKTTVINKNIDPEKIRLIHHGIASPARNSELMLRSLSLCDHRYELHFMFINHHSEYSKHLQNLANEFSPKRVFFHPPVPALGVVKEISKYDIGFFPLPPVNFNYRIALPNKLFEFIAAGLAVCIGPSPSMAEIINKYACGVIASDFKPLTLAELLNKTTTEQWRAMKKASLKASNHLTADNEMRKLMMIMKRLL
jgi:hypothetical protein